MAFIELTQMEGHGFPKNSGGLRSTAMVRLADRLRHLWDQVTTRESAYQPYKEEENEEDQQRSSRGDKSDPKKGSARVVPPYQGGGKRQKSPGLQGKSEEVNLRVEAALMDSRTFLITLSCRSIPRPCNFSAVKTVGSIFCH